MEELFTSVCQELDINREIPSDNQYIKEDVSDTKDNYKSLKLVSKQYFSTTNSNLKLTSIQKFFDLIDNKTMHLMSSKRYSYLSNILRDKQNANLKTLVEILINFADFETFHTLLLSIDAQDINRFDFTLRVAKRVTQLTRDKQTKTLLTTLLRKSLKISTNIDLKSRLIELKINKISEPDTDLIKTLFNQITKDDMNGKLFQDLTHELLIGMKIVLTFDNLTNF